MLFEFNNFWKGLACVVGFWTFYGIWGFELSVVTLLSLIWATHLNK